MRRLQTAEPVSTAARASLARDSILDPEQRRGKGIKIIVSSQSGAVRVAADVKSVFKHSLNPFTSPTIKRKVRKMKRKTQESGAICKDTNSLNSLGVSFPAIKSCICNNKGPKSDLAEQSAGLRVDSTKTSTRKKMIPLFLLKEIKSDLFGMRWTEQCLTQLAKKKKILLKTQQFLFQFESCLTDQTQIFNDGLKHFTCFKKKKERKKPKLTARNGKFHASH